MQGSRTYLALSASSSLRGQRSVISFLDNPTPCRPPTDMTVRHACGVQPELAMYSRLSCERRISDDCRKDCVHAGSVMYSRLSCERRISDVLIVKMVTRWISDVICARWICHRLTVVRLISDVLCARWISDVPCARWISDVLCARWIIDVLSVVKVMCTQDQ